MSQPYDVHAKLETPAAVLWAALDLWAARDDTRPQPEVREAADTAMDVFDAMDRELHLMRARLVSEIRARDDERARRRAGRAGTP